MNLTKLRDNQIQLIEYMQKGGYSKTYIDYIRYDINQLLKHGENYNNYLDYYLNYVQPKTSLGNLRHKRNRLTLIMNFDLYNEFPNRKRLKYPLIDNSNYSKLNDNFKKIIDTYQIESTKKNKKVETIHDESLCGASFLIYFQNKGYNDIQNIKERDVVGFFLNENGELKYSSTHKKKIKIVLKECVNYIDGCDKIISFLPAIKRSRKNIDYLTEEEISKIKNVLNDKNNNLSLRDKAIVTLLLYLGLRGCDVVNLKLSNIDWYQEKINIIQSKTDVPLELPLTTTIGNALYEYITKERSKVDLKNVFIRSDADYPITKGSTDIAVKNVFKEANIRQNDNKRKGTHIFRHNLATTLLKNEIPQPIISQVLGHSSPNSVECYLFADFYHLKQCSLSIEQFQNIKEII